MCWPLVRRVGVGTPLQSNEQGAVRSTIDMPIRLADLLKDQQRFGETKLGAGVAGKEPKTTATQRRSALQPGDGRSIVQRGSGARAGEIGG